jgi:methyl-accepting chemotaxis protein
MGKEKVETGTQNAKRCGLVLDEIVENVANVNGMVAEIAKASHEQAQGVSEITKAMNQLDQVTHQNASSSQQCSGASDQLKSQANTMKEIVASLLKTVLGENTNTSYDHSKSPTVTVHQSEAKIVSIKESIKKKTTEHPVIRKLPTLDTVPSEDDPRFKDA